MRYCFFSNKLSGRMRPRLISLLHLQCRARGRTPFFQVVHQSWRIFFSAFASVRYTRVRVLSHWICNENVLGNSAFFSFFFRHSFSSLSTRVSVSVHLLSLERFEPVDFPNKDVISVDYGVCIPTWRKTAKCLWYFLMTYDNCRKIFYLFSSL